MKFESFDRCFFIRSKQNKVKRSRNSKTIILKKPNKKSNLFTNEKQRWKLIFFLIKLMSINKSQEFIYFQNKAKHYENIKKAKPFINDKLQKQYRKTIDHTSPRTEPYNKSYQTKVENQNLINRLVNITKSKRTQVAAQGDYSRFFKIQRQFRAKNPYNQQAQRKISIQNQQMVNRLDQTKAVIGSTSEWHQNYKQQLSHRRNISRYDQNQRSKGSLHISTARFMPEHYKSYIQVLDSGQGESKGQNFNVISKEKLTKLPRILYNGRSNSVLVSEKSEKKIQLL